MTSFRLSHTFLAVHDQDEALRFYRDVLGFQVRNDVPFEQFRWVTVSPPDQPGVEIVLEHPTMGRGPEDADALAGLVAKGAAAGMIFAVDDCDAAFEHLRAAGAEVLQEPMDMPYGVRDCAFRDPSGNHLRFSAAKG